METPLFARLRPDYWTQDEFGEFAAFLSGHPEAGEVIPKSGGCRKLRWARPGMGKRGGTRVIYFNQLPVGRIVLLLIYAKSARENVATNVLRDMAKELKDG